MGKDENIDKVVVEEFGMEWSKFNQDGVSEGELRDIFNDYFFIFPWEKLPRNPIGFDLGSGSGRWAQFVAPRVGELHCIEPSSSALEVSRKKLSKFHNCKFYEASVSEIPLKDNSMDFAYSLGVLHHIPDTSQGIKSCVSKLKSGAPMLVYLYYDFDNDRPLWFKWLYKFSNIIRVSIISRLPYKLKYLSSQVIAAFVYYPLARTARIAKRMGIDTTNFPLVSYSDWSFYTMRTDALDRFGTRLEHRFTQVEIKEMMLSAGLKNIVFSDKKPYWCAVGVKS
ncbi:class I SAM-dependent methyltransferase [bacterium]|jgi:SAM-dependent methyltransferase|nr:class I SAM-dependent methyltransferase [bacterium]